jgi:hypothetical protein
MTLAQRFLRWWRRHRGRLEVARMAEAPVTLRRGVLVLVGEDAEPWAAVLLCPCGCDARTELLLAPGPETYWRLSQGRAGTSLSPSVWRTSGCRSHYFIRESTIVWC